jgi:hypothetical protein
VYDAATMRLSNWFQVALGATLAALIPIGTMAADVPASGSVAALNISAAVGTEAVRVSGTAPGAHQLQAVLYAKFSQDVPTVLLSRWPLMTDANGQFSTTLPIAPAYFRGAIITVVVQSPSAIPIAQGSVTLAAPNAPGPADALPPNYR